MSTLEFDEIELSNGETLRGHTVTEETAGDYITPGQTSRTVRPGEVLIATARPDVYDVASADAWAEIGSGNTDDNDVIDVDTDDSDIVDDDDFEPSEHKATEVRAYLSRDDVSAENKDRVRQAELSGSNRSSAFPKE